MGSMQRAGQLWPVFLVVETYDGDVSRDDARQNSPGDRNVRRSALHRQPHDRRRSAGGGRYSAQWQPTVVLVDQRNAITEVRPLQPESGKAGCGGILDWVPFVPVFQCQQHPAARSFVRCEHYSTLSAGREQRAMAIGKWAC